MSQTCGNRVSAGSSRNGHRDWFRDTISTPPLTAQFFAPLRHLSPDLVNMVTAFILGGPCNG